MSAVRVLAGIAMAACLAAPQSASKQSDWIAMFDGTSLSGWKIVPFSGRGEVQVRDGTIRLGNGRMTGVAWAGDFPRFDYEVRFQAARFEGKDFFASIIFPVKDSYCSWISGGWDGTVVGLSNLDGNDASENDTSTLHDFVQGRWYSFRLVVTANRIRGWIDDAPVIDVETTERKVELRFDDTDLCTPLGFASYRTAGGIRNIRYRRIGGDR